MCSGVVFCQFVNWWDHNFAVKAHIYLSFSLAIFGVVRYPHDIHSTIAVLVWPCHGRISFFLLLVRSVNSSNTWKYTHYHSNGCHSSVFVNFPQYLSVTLRYVQSYLAHFLASSWSQKPLEAILERVHVSRPTLAYESVAYLFDRFSLLSHRTASIAMIMCMTSYTQTDKPCLGMSIRVKPFRPTCAWPLQLQ